MTTNQPDHPYGTCHDCGQPLEPFTWIANDWLGVATATGRRCRNGHKRIDWTALDQADAPANRET